MKVMLCFLLSISLFPWESNRADRFEDIRYRVPGLFNYPVKYDKDGFHVGMAHRKKLGYSQTLGHVGSSNNSIYIDMGARSPDSSVNKFKRSYPNGHNFYTFAFEADPKFAKMYTGMENLTYIQKAVSNKDGDCFFSKKSSLTAHMSHVKTHGESMQVECVDLKNWLDHNIPHSALAVAKMDIEKTEFELVPYLLQYPDTFRRIDELYLECHHIETWGHHPHRFSECLKLFEDVRKIGIVVHEWF